MNQQEYRTFLEHLFRVYVEPRLARVRVHHRFDDEFGWARRRLLQALAVTDFIRYECDQDEDIYSTFRRRTLESTVDAAGDSVGWLHRLAEESGYLAAMDDHSLAILDGMEPAHLPPEEAALLRVMGRWGRGADLPGMILALKSRRDDLASSVKEAGVSWHLGRVTERINAGKARLAQQAENTQDVKPPSRRWFKGLGQICQGVGLSMANIALALELVPLQVSPETKG